MEPKGSVIITTTCQDPETCPFPAPSPGLGGCRAPLPVYLVGHALSLGLPASSLAFIYPHLSPASPSVPSFPGSPLCSPKEKPGHGCRHRVPSSLYFISTIRVHFPSQACILPGTKLSGKEQDALFLKENQEALQPTLANPHPLWAAELVAAVPEATVRHAAPD